jgi:hypothetical protein
LRQRRRQRKGAGRRQHAERESDLHQAAVKPAPSRRRVLEHDQRRAAPLAAEADALDDAQRNQQDRRPDADLMIGRQQSDAERTEPHHRHGDHQHRLAADAVAEMAEQDAADRAGEKAGRVCAERRQRAGQRIDVREEQAVEDQGRRGAIDQKVVPFDDGADRSGKHHGGHRPLLAAGRSRCDVNRCRQHAHVTLL